MAEGNHSRTLNMLGALALALADRIATRAETASGLHDSAASALVVIANHPGEPIDAIRRTLGLTHSGAVRLVDEVLQRLRMPVVTAGLPLAPVHALLDDGPLAVTCDEETMQVKIKPVLDGRAVDLRHEPESRRAAYGYSSLGQCARR